MTFQKAIWEQHLDNERTAALIVPISPAAQQGWAAKLVVGNEWTALSEAEVSALHAALTQALRPIDEPAEPMEIVVTVDTVELLAGKIRRYVVVEGEELFARVPSGPVPEAEGTPAAGGATRPPSISDIRRIREEHLGRFDFGGRWLRSYGKVNEMVASLATWEVVEVERIPRSKVWGER